MNEIEKKALSETELLRQIYLKLAGDSPALDTSKALSKASLLRGMAELPIGGGLTIVQDIPTTLNPGQKVWCVATQSELIGADPDNGIFPTLAAGTPWPVKGYKEIHVYRTASVFTKIAIGFDASLVTIQNTAGNNIFVVLYDGEPLDDVFVNDGIFEYFFYSNNGGYMDSGGAGYLTIYNRNGSAATSSVTFSYSCKLYPPAP